MAEKHSVFFAKDGAAALEVAIAKVPGVIIADADLPLIDARKLAEILRTNPRTQQARFFFLGSLESEGSLADLFDEVLSDPVDPGAVARRVTELLAKQDQLDALEGDLGSASELEGQLNQISLVDLLQSFHLNRKEGEIHLSRPGEDGLEEMGQVVLRAGDIVDARVGESGGDKALFRLLSWSEGRFAFRPGEVEEARVQIQAPTRALLMEGLRQIEEGREHRSELPAPGSRVSLRVRQTELPHMVHPLTQEVLVSLELYERVEDIVDHCSFPDYQVLRTLQTLEGRRIVAIDPADVAVALPVGGGVSLFTPPQERRLRGWLDSKYPSSAVSVEAKLVVAGNSADAVERFSHVLCNVKGCEVSVPMDGIPLNEGVQDISRIPVGIDTWLLFVNLPTHCSYDSLWPAVAYGGLGVLFLIDGDLTPALSVIRPTLERLADLPQTRFFFLRMGEEDSSEERSALREALSFVETDPMLFFLEQDEDMVESLGALLARILP
jgi:CheY-like chemotaxis protein